MTGGREGDGREGGRVGVRSLLGLNITLSGVNYVFQIL